MATFGSWSDQWLSKAKKTVHGLKPLLSTAKLVVLGCTPKMFTLKKTVPGSLGGQIAGNTMPVDVIGPQLMV